MQNIKQQIDLLLGNVTGLFLIWRREMRIWFLHFQHDAMANEIVPGISGEDELIRQTEAVA